MSRRNAGVDETVVDETVVDETVVDETVVDETVVDKTVVDETVVDETVVDETVVDETGVDELGINRKLDFDRKWQHISTDMLGYILYLVDKLPVLGSFWKLTLLNFMSSYIHYYSFLK